MSVRDMVVYLASLVVGVNPSFMVLRWLLTGSAFPYIYIYITAER